MISQEDIKKLELAIQDYERQSSNYHFYNHEIAELERCEKEIKSVIDKYTGNVPVLMEIGKRLETIKKYPPHELIQGIKEQIWQNSKSRDSEEKVSTISQEDTEKLAHAIQDYERQSSNYHFYNHEIAELERCEKEMKSVIDKYTNNVPVLMGIGKRLESIKKYPPHELIQGIKEQIWQNSNSRNNEMNSYYSLDGQKFSTIEEAEARNEMIRGMIKENHNEGKQIG